MARLDELPPDLRATLSLLVDRGKSYAQVAELLSISEDAVRERAHAALDALAGAPGEALAPYEAPAAGGTPNRGPSNGGAAGASTTAAGVPRRTRGGSSWGGAPGAPGVSRRGGAVLLVGIVVVIVVVVVALSSGDGSHAGSTNTGSAGASTLAHGASGATGASGSSKAPTVTNQLTLTSPEPGSKAIGVVEVLAEGSQRAFYLAAEHLPPSTGFTYVIWLYNSPTSAEAISKAPTVGSNGRLQGGALLPSNAGDYHQILLTKETSERPTHPGPVALSGAFSLDK